MNEIQIILKESGSNAEIKQDFNLYQGCYHNVQISVWVPTGILLSGTDEESGEQEFTNAVKIGAILTSESGKKIVTESYFLSYVKREIFKGKKYAVYTRLLPKDFTAISGDHTVVSNVVSIDNTKALNPKILSITTSQTATFTVNKSEYLGQDEPIKATETETIKADISTVSDKVYQNEQAINDLNVKIAEGKFPARSFAAWRASELYGADEYVYYPSHGEHGALLKTLRETSQPPYVNGALNTNDWELVVDYYEAPTVEVSGVETLEPGQNATVENVGTGNDMKLLFGIPKGEKGKQGYTGTRGSLWASNGKPPSVGAQYNSGDQYLDTSTGNVYQLNNLGQWINTGNIRGPQGNQGDIGPIGPIGPQGIMGPEGKQGVPGKPFRIVGILETASELPEPTKDNQSEAYVIGNELDYDLYVIIGNDTDGYIWKNIGKIETIPGPQGEIGPEGKQGEKGEPGTPGITKPIYYAVLSDDIKPTATGSTDIFTPTSPAIGVNDFFVSNFGSLYRITTITPGGNVNTFTATYVTSIKGESGISPTGITLTGTSGTLTDDQLSILQANDFNYIVLDNEIYNLQDKNHEDGYLVYTHVGSDTSQNYFIKTITITISSKGWLLNIKTEKKLYLHLLSIGRSGNDSPNFAGMINFLSNTSEPYTDNDVRFLRDVNNQTKDNGVIVTINGKVQDYNGSWQTAIAFMAPYPPQSLKIQYGSSFQTIPLSHMRITDVVVPLI